jgi:hypothetical protein
MAESAETFHYVGTVDFISQDAVEVSGHRGLVGTQTSFVSDGHPVAPTSIHPGQQGDLEVDSDGRALELRVTGVVE